MSPPTLIHKIINFKWGEMDGCLDGCVGRWMGGWLGGQVDGWMGGRMSGWVDGCTGGWIITRAEMNLSQPALLESIIMGRGAKGAEIMGTLAKGSESSKKEIVGLKIS